MTIRLQKYLSGCGLGSRRKMEIDILSGKVKINGEVVNKLGFKVSDDDIVEYEGRVVKPVEKKYYILNKPEGFVCSKNPQEGNRSIFELVSDKDSSLFNVGRLDKNSKGLIIITNDGDFANRIIHPSTSLLKKYIVVSNKKIDKNILKFSEGININGVFYKAVMCKILKDNVMEIHLKEGKKREIREVFKYFNQDIIELKRFAIGNLDLKRINLKEGEIVKIDLKKLENLLYGNSYSSEHKGKYKKNSENKNHKRTEK